MKKATPKMLGKGMAKKAGQAKVKRKSRAQAALAAARKARKG